MAIEKKRLLKSFQSHFSALTTTKSALNTEEKILVLD